MSESTETLLRAFAADLQRQLRRSATVEDVSVLDATEAVTLVVTVRVAAHELQIIGRGENLLTAYTDLISHAPETILSSAFRQVLEA